MVVWKDGWLWHALNLLQAVMAACLFAAVLLLGSALFD